MCYEYWERMERLDERRRRELLELQRRQAERDLDRITLDRSEWTLPEEPARTQRDKVPV
jgi:hypothetical protein